MGATAACYSRLLKVHPCQAKANQLSNPEARLPKVVTNPVRRDTFSAQLLLAGAERSPQMPPPIAGRRCSYKPQCLLPCFVGLSPSWSTAHRPGLSEARRSVQLSYRGTFGYEHVEPRKWTAANFG